ncbi:hypothetical protein FRX54_04400, partial [Streptococcus sp. sy004]
YFHNPHLVRLIQFSKVLTSPLRRQLLHSIKLYIPCQLLCQKKLRFFKKGFDALNSGIIMIKTLRYSKSFWTIYSN